MRVKFGKAKTFFLIMPVAATCFALLLAGCGNANDRIPLKEGYIEKTGPMVYARQYPAIVTLNNRNILICGGNIQNNLYKELRGKKTPCEIYDPKTEKFYPTGASNHREANYVPWVLLPNGKVLALGYPTLFHGLPKSTEIYDPATGEWSLAPAMLDAGQKMKRRHAAILVSPSKVLITGGNFFPDGTKEMSKSTELYDYLTNTFLPGPSMIGGHAGHQSISLQDSRILIIDINSCEIYDYRTNQFKRIGSLKVPRRSFGTVLLKDGRVLVIGGQTERLVALASIEVFDPKTDTFELVGQMANPRSSGPSAVLLQNGKVLIGGGFVGYKVNNTLEIYDPKTNTSEIVGIIPEPNPVTMVPLNNGKVLMLRKSSKRRDFPAEIYVPEPNSSK